MPEKIEIRYFRKGSEIPDTGTLLDHLYLIRNGEVELKTADGELQVRLGENDMFGYGSSHAAAGTSSKHLPWRIPGYISSSLLSYTGFAIKTPGSTVSSIPPMK